MLRRYSIIAALVISIGLVSMSGFAQLAEDSTNGDREIVQGAPSLVPARTGC